MIINLEDWDKATDGIKPLLEDYLRLSIISMFFDKEKSSQAESLIKEWF